MRDIDASQPEAYLEAHKRGIYVKPQIMIPMIFSDHEVEEIVPIIIKTMKDVFSQAGHMAEESSPGCDIGAMIEIPRACLRADNIALAKNIAVISFGTNDLTQLVFGLSRDDTQQFMVRN